MNSKQRRKATRHMELERAALLTGMCRMATKANEAAQALGKFGNAMKAAKPPKMNFVFLSGEANPLKLDASERRFMVVLDDVEPPNDLGNRRAAFGASVLTDELYSTREKRT